MAYIEGSREVQPGDPIAVRVDGAAPREAAITRIGRMEIELEDPRGGRIALDFRATNEAIWDRGRRHLEAQAGVSEPVPLHS
jgi:hypothetical protein